MNFQAKQKQNKTNFCGKQSANVGYDKSPKEKDREREWVRGKDRERGRESGREGAKERGIEEDCVPKQRRTVCRETFTILIT